MAQIKNFKEDELILPKSDIDHTTANHLSKTNQKELIILDDNKTLNIYSALIKLDDFGHKNLFSKFVFVAGDELNKEIHRILKDLPNNLKEKNYLKLRKKFQIYCNKKPINQTTFGIAKYIKNWTSKNLYPLHFLRFITLNNKNKFVDLISKIEYFTPLCKTDKIYLPKTLKELENKKLWYLIGIILGDGYLLENKKDYRLVIADGSSNKNELLDSYKHIRNLSKLFSILFKIKNYKIEDYGTWFDLIISNKILTRFINFFFGMPYGKKKGKLEIPKILNLLNNKETYEKYLWRGIFDSDAMINPNSRNIEIASSDLPFMKECKSFLSKLNIEEKIKKGIDGKKEIYIITSILKPLNLKNLE